MIQALYAQNFVTIFQPFLDGQCHIIAMRHIVPYHSTPKMHLPVGDLDLYHSDSLRPPYPYHPKRIRIESSVFPQYTFVTNGKPARAPATIRERCELIVMTERVRLSVCSLAYLETT